MDRGKALTALQALAHQTRLDLVHLLMPHGQDGLPAGQIGLALGMTASRLSFHLAALAQAGLLRSRKQSRNVFYTVDTDGMGGTIGYLLNTCCHADPSVKACCQTTAMPARKAASKTKPHPKIWPDDTGPG